MSQALTLGRQLAVSSSSRLFLTLWGGLFVVDVCRTLSVSSLGQTTALTLLAAACSLRQQRVTALISAGTMWMVITGFVVNSLGELRLTGWLDGVRLLVLVLGCLVAAEARR